MRKWAVLTGVAALLSAPATRADVTSDRAAAILIFPRVATERISETGTTSAVLEEEDTVIQITNTSNDPVQLKCYYINANNHCSTSGALCNGPAFFEPISTCPFGDEVCQPGWSETDFRVTLTAQQPIAWRASHGLSEDEIPLDGALRPGPNGQSNSGTRVPPVSAEPTFPQGVPPDVTFEQFQGELKCVVVDDQERPIARNVIKGEATRIRLVAEAAAAPPTGGSSSMEAVPGVEKYNAVGIQAIGGDADGDHVLQLGGEAGEYNGCPNVLIVDHLFDALSAMHPSSVDLEHGTVNAPALPDVSSTQSVVDVILLGVSYLTLVPCAEDLRAQVPSRVVAQFLVFNEFEQRFSTSAPVDCFFDKPLSLIDTPDSTRSIFNLSVAGTIAGQTRVRGVGGGLVGVLREENITESETAGSASNLHFQGERTEADRIVVP